MRDSRLFVLILFFLFLAALFSGCRNKIYESRTVVDVRVEMTLSDTVIPEYEMCVSPDGDRLVFPRRVYYYNVWAISTIDGSSSKIGRFHTRYYSQDFEVSYNRQYVALRDDNFHIHIYDIMKDSLLLSSSIYPLGNIQWAYNDQMIYVQGERGVIWIWDIMNDQFTGIPHDGFFSYEFRISPDEKKLAVLSNPREYSGNSLDVYEFDSGNWHHLIDHLSGDVLFCWTADSRHILLNDRFPQVLSRDSLYIINLEGQGKRPLEEKFDIVLDIVYSPSDLQNYWLAREKKNNRSSLWRFEPDEETEAICLSDTYWSSLTDLECFNGETVLDFKYTYTLNLDLYSISLNHLAVLTSGQFTDRFPIFTKEGDCLFFTRDDNLYRMDLDSKRAECVISPFGDPYEISDGFCLSPNDMDLTFNSNGSIINLRLSDLRSSLIVDSETHDNRFLFPAWSPNGDYLACLDQIGRIHIFQNNGTESFPEIKVIPKRCDQIFWSPSGGFYGDQILCYYYSYDQYSHFTDEWFMLDPWSEKYALMDFRYEPRTLCWHPDGKSILYSSEEGLKRRVLFTEMNE